VPQLKVDVDRAKAETLQVSIDDVFSTLAAYLGSSYVGQFNKFGRVFQVYVQADSQYRLRPQDVELLPVRNKQGEMIPLGTAVGITPTVGPSLLSLYNLYPSSTVMGLPATGFSSGQAAALMEQIATSRCRRAGYEWTAMSYQEARRQPDLHLRAGDAAGVPGAGRTI
jgi:HAE1 family hydrophobic/amphiphilic exporter-1